MAERVCAIVAFSKILTLGGIVKGGAPPLCLYPPLTRRNMKRNYCVQYFRYDVDAIVLWKQVYFEHTPSIQLIMSELFTHNFDSVTISKVK